MAVAELESESLITMEEESPWKIVWRRFRRHRLALAGIVTISIIALACFAASVIAPYDPIHDIARGVNGQILKNDPPSLEHIMGTDNIGRDVFSRLLYAGRISLAVAFIVTFASIFIGVLIGAISGYYGGWFDDVIQRFTEFMIAIPLLPLLLAFSALLRGVNLIPGLPREWNSAVIITIILTVFGWMSSSILIRGMVLSLRNQEFTEAAKALGSSNFSIILRHMIPNSLAPIIVSATLGLGTVIIIESALSFLGFGIQPPVPTWGNMLNEYQNEMWTQPAKVFYPGLAIFVCVLAFNYIGDGLRDAMDPRLKR
ncbi:MAG TPA: ABC transporter permease [Anaerolineales bacterium]|nr:ABC transporter permease [Anaerolineales bacterium]